MNKKIVQVYYGDGKGKTTAAIGQCIRAASLGDSVIIIQFLKGRDIEEFSFLNKLEPQIKLFRFEKAKEFFCDLSIEEQNEEKQNILNGLNFARKVIETGECNTLVLDEVLGLIEHGIIRIEDVIKLIQLREDELTLILTGNTLPDQLVEYADMVSKIEQIKG